MSIDHTVYTIRLDNISYQIAREHIRPRLRGARVRVEVRASGEVAVRFEDKYLKVARCEMPKAGRSAAPVQKAAAGSPGRKGPNAGGRSQWMKGFWKQPGPSIGKAIEIANATS